MTHHLPLHLRHTQTHTYESTDLSETAFLNVNGSLRYVASAPRDRLFPVGELGADLGLSLGLSRPFCNWWGPWGSRRRDLRPLYALFTPLPPSFTWGHHKPIQKNTLNCLQSTYRFHGGFHCGVGLKRSIQKFNASAFQQKSAYLLFDALKKGSAFFFHGRRPLLVLLLQFRTGLLRVSAGLQLELVRESQAVVQHRQTFFYELRETFWMSSKVVFVMLKRFCGMAVLVYNGWNAIAR